MKIKFKKEEESILDSFFLRLEFMSGDADAYEYEEVGIPGVKYSNYKDHLPLIEETVGKYQILSNLTNDEDYDEIKDSHGEEIADLYDIMPNDSTADFQFKASLSGIEIVAYNEKGEKLVSYV